MRARIEPNARPLMSCWRNSVMRSVITPTIPVFATPDVTARRMALDGGILSSARNRRLHGRDRLDVFELAVGDGQNHGGLRGVAVRVNRDFAGDALKILRRRQRVADLRAVGRAGAFDGVRQNHRRIIAQRGHGVGRFAVLGTEFLHKILNGGRGVLGRIMRGKITAFQRLAADGHQRGGFPAVAAEQRHRDAELPRLQRNQSHLRVIARNKDAVGIRRP